MTQKQATEIKANAIYRIKSENCWAVPSNSSDAMYKVCFNNESANWSCTCAHGFHQANRGQGAKCCHVGAVQVSIRANLQASDPALLQSVQEYAQYKAEVKAQHDSELKAAQIRPNYDLPLHGSRGFRLLK